MWKIVGGILVAVLIIGAITYRTPVEYMGEPYHPRTDVEWVTSSVGADDFGWIVNCIMTTMRDDGYLDDVADAFADSIVERLEEDYILVPREKEAI